MINKSDLCSTLQSSPINWFFPPRVWLDQLLSPSGHLPPFRIHTPTFSQGGCPWPMLSFIWACNVSFSTLSGTQFPYSQDFILNIREAISRCVMPCLSPHSAFLKTLFMHIIICLMSAFPLEFHKDSKQVCLVSCCIPNITSPINVFSNEWVIS